MFACGSTPLRIASRISGDLRSIGRPLPPLDVTVHDPKAAEPERTPAAVLARTLDMRLRSQHPAQFAGLAIAQDGTLEVFAVGRDAAFARLVDELRLGIAPDMPVRIVPDRRHSLKELEVTRDQVIARRLELEGLGISVARLGIDLRANKVRIGLPDPSAEATAVLIREFGAGRIVVVRGSGFLGA